MGGLDRIRSFFLLSCKIMYLGRCQHSTQHCRYDSRTRQIIPLPSKRPGHHIFWKITCEDLLDYEIFERILRAGGICVMQCSMLLMAMLETLMFICRQKKGLSQCFIVRVMKRKTSCSFTVLHRSTT